MSTQRDLVSNILKEGVRKKNEYRKKEEKKDNNRADIQQETKQPPTKEEHYKQQQKIHHGKEPEKEMVEVKLNPYESYDSETGRVTPAPTQQPVKDIPEEKWKDISKNQYIKKTERAAIEASDTKKEWETQKKNIKPEEKYEDPETGKVVSGSIILAKYFPEEGHYSTATGKFIPGQKEIDEYATGTGEIYAEAISLPVYAEVKEEEHTGEIKIDHNLKKREKGVWEKLGEGDIGIEEAAIATINPISYIAGSIAQGKPLTKEQFAKSFYVGATRWPDTTFSPVPVIGEPVDKLQDKWIVQEGQVYEKTRRGDYSAITLDAATSPAMLEVYITLATLGVGKAAAPVGRAAVRTGAKVYSRISRFIPEERFLGKSVNRFGHKFVSTEVGGDIYKWGVKGYRFGYEAGMRSTTESVKKTIPSKWTTVKGVITRTVLGDKGKRVLLSPEKYKLAQKTLKDLTTEVGGTTISRRIGQTDVIIESNFQRTGLGNKLFKKTLRVSGSFIDEPIETVGKTVFKAPGFVRGETTKGITMKGNFGGIGDIITPSGRFITTGTRTSKLQAFKNMVISEGSDIYKTFSDPVREWFAKGAKGAASEFKKNHPLKWFIADTSARVKTIIKTQSDDLIIKGEGSAAGRLGLIQSTRTYTIPARDVTGISVLGIRSGVIPITKTVTKTRQDLEPVVYTIPEQKQKTPGVFQPITSTKQDQDNIPVIVPIHGQYHEPIPSTVIFPTLKQDEITEIVPVPVKTPPPRNDMFYSFTPVSPFPFLHPKKLYGSSGKQPGFDSWGKYKKYREKKTIDLLDLDLWG